MAKGVPPGYTRFLQLLLSNLPLLAKQRAPQFADRFRGAQLLRSDYQVDLQFASASTFRWSFRQNRLTGIRESKTFNFEFTPCYPGMLKPEMVERAWKSSGLQGEVGFDGSEFFFQIVWGHGRQTERLVHDRQLIDSLQTWAVDAASLAIRLIEDAQGHALSQPQTVPLSIANPSLGRHVRPVAMPTEQLLEQSIIAQWEPLFGDKLHYVSRQVYCGAVGILDILARDIKTNDYVVIELKKAMADDAVFGQLARYMGWIKLNRADAEGVCVRGLIIAQAITPALQAAAHSHPGVDLLCFSTEMLVSAGDQNAPSNASGAGIIDMAEERVLEHLDFCNCGALVRRSAVYCARCGAPAKIPPVAAVNHLGEHRREQEVDGAVSASAHGTIENTAPSGFVACRCAIDAQDIQEAMEAMACLDGGRGLAEDLSADLRGSGYRFIRLSTVHRLSKWCHPDRDAGRERRMRPVAESMSIMLFGFVVARTLHPEDHRDGPLESQEPARSGSSVLIATMFGIVLTALMLAAMT